MERRVSLITLGVADIGRSRVFYERLGFKPSSGNDSVAFIQLAGMALALFGRAALAEDAHVANSPPGFSGITIAQNQRSKADVDRVMAEAEAAGATIMKPAQDVFWGGYSGYFADPDGYLWEVAYNPFTDLT